MIVFRLNSMEMPGSCGGCGLPMDLCDKWKTRNWGAARPQDCPLVEIPRWIPVTERLPLYGQDVLAVRTYGDGEKCQEVLMAHIAVWNEGTGKKWWNATNITHWMPLPEPPEEEH